MGTADSLYDRAIAYATDRGTRDGRNAAGWYTQDTIGGYVTRAAEDNARTILRGIEDGDPAVLNTLPYADLSGEWADTLTGPELVEDALWEAYSHKLTDRERDSVRYQEREAAWFADICDAYEVAYADAAQAEIERACRAILGKGLTECK